MKPVVALSTCWNSPRHTDGYEMLREAADLGFEWVELSHGVRITLVPGILKAVEAGLVRVSSCHNFCPLPTGVLHAAPNLYMPSARDSRERSQWQRHTRRTVDFAKQVGARKVVLHLGAVDFPWFNPARKIARRTASDPGRDFSSDAGFQRVIEKSMRRIRERMPDYWRNTRECLEELLPYVAERGAQLGVENRESIVELPLDADHGELLDGLGRPDVVGYWHDTGHAHLKERLGLLRHREHLERNAARLIGFHLHDVGADGRDHQRPGAGAVDFEMVSGFWRPEHTLVIELSPRLSPDEVRASKERVDALVAARFG